MRFETAELEVRERFAEANSLLNYLRTISPPPLHPADANIKALRGLWLVSMYAAIERSVNIITDTAIAVISSNNVISKNCFPSLHSIFHFDKVMSINDCGKGKIFDKSSMLFEASLSTKVLFLKENPLSESLQNVDAGTISWVLRLFGAPDITPSSASSGRINALRERRNSVAHGRESASKVGERYTLEELSNIYKAADEIVLQFFYNLKEYCDDKKYDISA